MATIFNSNVTNNFSTLCNTVKGANTEVKTAKCNIMYYVNQLNKLARKNEFVDGVNVKELGKLVRNYALNKGYEIPVNAPYNAYLFYKGVNGVSGYTKTHKVKANSAFCIDIVVTDFVPVVLSESGLINAYKYILGIDAKATDKAAKETLKAANKAKRDAKKAAKETLKREQLQARIDYNNGKIDINQFAAIMAKVA